MTKTLVWVGIGIAVVGVVAVLALWMRPMPSTITPTAQTTDKTTMTPPPSAVEDGHDTATREETTTSKDGGAEGGERVVESSSETVTPPTAAWEVRLPDGRPMPQIDMPSMAKNVVTMCGACHKTPPPDILPKRAWVEVILPEMIANWLPTVGVNLSQHQADQLSAFYAKLAPDELAKLPYGPGDSPVKFEAMKIGDRGFLAPLVSNVKIADIDGDQVMEIVLTDTELNRVSIVRQERGVWEETKIAEIHAPVHAEVFDTDGDGRLDILVAAMGQLMPVDDPIGSVTLLRQTAEGGFERQIIAEKIDRATDARPADVNGDGRMDYIVGMFGWRESGGIDWYEQLEDGSFKRHKISDSHGPVRLNTTDLNNDGLMDFVILMAQEFEQVIAFINTGDDGYGGGGGDDEDALSLRFEPYILYEGPHPMYGSSGMTLVDLDQDGDMDVLFTNGDAFDLDKNPKPYHGVQWLENQGAQAGRVPQFVFRDIGRFYGAMAAKAGDLDGDGDLDVVAISQYNDWRDPRRQAVVWYENDGRQRFTRHDLGRASTHLATVAVGDVTGDGRPDIVTGTLYAGAWEMDTESPFRFPPPEERKRLMLWTNPGSVKE